MKMINASYGQRNKRMRRERENESERIITLFQETVISCSVLKFYHFFFNKVYFL